MTVIKSLNMFQTLGNHEFDDGLAGLIPYLKSVKVPWVCSNIRTEDEPAFNNLTVRPWLSIDVNGRKVAVVGYLTPETKVTRRYQAGSE